MFESQNDNKINTIDVSSEQVPTPKEAIACLAYKLMEGSSLYTKREFASMSAMIACVEFREYLDNLSAELREQLWDLKTPSLSETIPGKSLGDTITILSKSDCVEEAALRLISILKNNKDLNILESKPHLNKTGKPNEKVGDVNLCLVLFSTVNDVNDGVQNIKKYIKPLSENERILATKEKNYDGDSILHIAANDKDDRRVSAILMLIPDTNRLLELIKEKNHIDNTVLHIAAANTNPEPLKAILSRIPEDKRIEAITQKGRWDETVLDAAGAKHREVILSLLPDKDKEIVYEHMRNKNSPISDHHAALFTTTANSIGNSSPNQLSSSQNKVKIPEASDASKKQQWIMPRKKK